MKHRYYILNPFTSLRLLIFMASLYHLDSQALTAVTWHPPESGENQQNILGQAPRNPH